MIDSFKNNMAISFNLPRSLIIGLILMGLMVTGLVFVHFSQVLEQSQEIYLIQNPPWKDLQPYRGSIKTNGETGSKRRFYEKDYTHKDVEVYDSNGVHLGSMDAETGKMTKPAVKGRKLNRR